MAECNTPSKLACLCVGGQLDPACCDDVLAINAIRVISELKGAGASHVMDPTNCAIIPPTQVVETVETSDGCWRTCDLKINAHDDPTLRCSRQALSTK